MSPFLRRGIAQVIWYLKVIKSQLNIIESSTWFNHSSSSEFTLINTLPASYIFFCFLFQFGLCHLSPQILQFQMEFLQIPGSLRLSVHLCLWNRAKCCHRWVMEAAPGSGWRTKLWIALVWREGMLCWDRAECPCPPRALAAPTAQGGLVAQGSLQSTSVSLKGSLHWS